MSTARKLSGLVVLFAALLSACSLEQAHGYVQSSDESLTFRYPADWEEVDVQPLGLEWVTGIDGAVPPSSTNAEDFVQQQPFVVAQVLPLDQTRHDQASKSVLRTLALSDGRDPIAGDDPTIRVLFYEDVLDDRGFEGHRVRFEVDLANGTAIAEQLAVFDPERTKIHRIRVACSDVCFQANAIDIDDIFDSVRFR